MQHLAFRPKKMQLIEDRRQSIATENVKLIERMSKIMSSTRQQKGQQIISSKNDPFKRREIERVNIENRLMAERLQSITPVLNAAKLEQEFVLHLKDVKTLRKKAIKTPTKRDHQTITYPQDQYLDSQGSLSNLNLPQNNDWNSMNSMAEFRKQVIGSRKGNRGNSFNSVNLSPQNQNLKSPNQDPFMLFHAER
jgi:hypothetical protein